MLSKSRIEYLSYGLNWRTGCVNACTYCYMAALAHRFDREPAGGWATTEALYPDPAATLRAALAARRTLPTGSLMLSTGHDPAMTPVVAAELRALVAVLGEFNLWPQTLILTKCPTQALTALAGLGSGPQGVRLGASLTSLGVGLTQQYEPGAELPADRLAALMAAHAQGYRTWVSLEPPLPEVYLHKLLPAALSLPGRPWLVLGKLNYRGADAALRAWSAAEHWAADREQARALLAQAGYTVSKIPQSGGYWIKSELERAA